MYGGVKWLMSGDKILENRGKGRDQAGDFEKTRILQGKTEFLSGKEFKISQLS